MNTNFSRATALAAVCVAALAPALSAQVTEVARAPIADVAQLTFGYRCDDIFVVRNEGNAPIDLEYSVEKSNKHTLLTLNAREVVQLDSKSNRPLELWVGGSLVATAKKDKRSCKDVGGGATVDVAPLEVTDNNANSQSTFNNRGNPFYYGAFGYYDPFMYGSFGYRSLYPRYVTVPIVVNRRVGVSRSGGGRRGR